MRPQIVLLTLLAVISILLGSALLHFRQNAPMLQQDNDALRAELREAQRPKEAPAESDKITLNTAAPTLPAHAQEVDQLRSELAEVKQKGHLLTNLLTENQLLRGQLEESQKTSPSQHAVPTPASDDGALTREQIEAYLCASHLFQISIAAGSWAQTHGGYAPTNFVSLQEYLAPMILVCPSAKPKSVAQSWKNFDVSTITYRMWSPGTEWEFPNLQSQASHGFAECPIHHTRIFNCTGAAGIPTKYIPLR